jgi:hypothetical protein
MPRTKTPLVIAFAVLLYAVGVVLLSSVLPYRPLWVSERGPLAVSGDGRTLIRFHSRGQLELLDGDTGQPLRIISFPMPDETPTTPVYSMNADGTRASVVFYDRHVVLIDLTGGPHRRYPKTGFAPMLNMNRFLGEELLLLKTIEKNNDTDVHTLLAWDYRREEIRWQVVGGINLATSVDGTQIAVAETAQRRLRIRDARTGRLIAECAELPDFPEGTLHLEFRDEARTLLVEHQSQNSRSWELDAESGRVRRELPTAIERDDIPVESHFRWRIDQDPFHELPRWHPFNWWTRDTFRDGLLFTHIQFRPAGSDRPAFHLPRWTPATPVEPLDYVLPQSGDRFGYDNHIPGTTRTQFEWHALPPRTNWQLAGLWAPAPVVCGLLLWKILGRRSKSG